jgi:hypothetical protein
MQKIKEFKPGDIVWHNRHQKEFTLKKIEGILYYLEESNEIALLDYLEELPYLPDSSFDHMQDWRETQIE